MSDRKSLPFYEPFLQRHFPSWGTRRAAARVEASILGGVPNRLSESYPRNDGTMFGTTLERFQAMNTRDRGYHAYENNPVARALVKTEVDNVIGDGVNFQATSSSEAWNRECEDRYYQWADECDVRGLFSGAEIQRMIWDRSRVAGDCGWVLVAQGPESRIQVVPAENIRTPDNLLGTREVRDGIQYDRLGRPLKFYLFYQDEFGARSFTPVVARDFVYLAHMTKPNQGRPESCYSTIFERLSQLDRYVDGVALAAWMATVFGLLIRQPNGAKELQGLGTVLNSQGNEQRAFTLENGSVKYLGEKGEVAQVQASQPMQQTPDFIRAMMRLIGMPFDMPLEVLARDMSTVNFASARIGLIPFYRACRVRFDTFRHRWSRTIRWWLSREAQRAADDPKRWKNKFPADYWNHELAINAWDYTDPVSEAQADLLQMDSKTKSPQMVIAERGRNMARILKDFEEWRRITKDLPDVRSTMTRHPQSGVGATGDPLGQEQVEPPGDTNVDPAAPNTTDTGAQKNE